MKVRDRVADRRARREYLARPDVTRLPIDDLVDTVGEENVKCLPLADEVCVGFLLQSEDSAFACFQSRDRLRTRMVNLQRRWDGVWEVQFASRATFAG